MKKLTASVLAALALSLSFSAVPNHVFAEKKVEKQKEVKVNKKIKEALDEFFEARDSEFKDGKEAKLLNNNADKSIHYVKYMEEVHGIKLKDFKSKYTVDSVKEDKKSKTTEVTLSLIQELTFDNGIDSGFSDQITVNLDENLNINHELSAKTLKNEIDTDKLIKIGKEIKEKQRKLEKNKKKDNSKLNSEKAISAQSYSYDGADAATYARKYALSPNPAYATWGNDCTNFVSQALHYGGIPERLTTSGNYLKWYYTTSYDVSPSWINVDDFYEVLNSYTIFSSELDYASELELGDVVQYDMYEDGDWNHTAIVTKITTSGTRDLPLVSYHSENQLNVAWDFYVAYYESRGIDCDYRLIDIHE